MSAHKGVAVVTLHGEGRSQTFIAQRVGINQSTVSRIQEDTVEDQDRVVEKQQQPIRMVFYDCKRSERDSLQAPSYKLGF
jgi:hypothetical protein